MNFSLTNLLLILLIAWFAGYFVARVGYPPVLGELAAGMIFGPPLLNLIHPDDGTLVLGKLGVLLMMLFIGMSIKLKDLVRSLRTAIAAALGGFLLPFLLGYLALVGLGVGAGFALGAACCHPEAEVWIIFGDGACGYGLVEFDSFVRHRIPVIAIVGNDAGWTQIAREQVKMLGDDVGTVLARTDYHAVAAGFGAEGILVRQLQELPAALHKARALARSGKPVLVNIWLDKTEFREGSLSM